MPQYSSKPIHIKGAFLLSISLEVHAYFIKGIDTQYLNIISIYYSCPINDNNNSNKNSVSGKKMLFMNLQNKSYGNIYNSDAADYGYNMLCTLSLKR